MTATPKFPTDEEIDKIYKDTEETMVPLAQEIYRQAIAPTMNHSAAAFLPLRHCFVSGYISSLSTLLPFALECYKFGITDPRQICNFFILKASEETDNETS